MDGSDSMREWAGALAFAVVCRTRKRGRGIRQDPEWSKSGHLSLASRRPHTVVNRWINTFADDALQRDLAAKGSERAQMFGPEKIATRWLEADVKKKRT